MKETTRSYANNTRDDGIYTTNVRTIEHKGHKVEIRHHVHDGEEAGYNVTLDDVTLMPSLDLPNMNEAETLQWYSLYVLPFLETQANGNQRAVDALKVCREVFDKRLRTLGVNKNYIAERLKNPRIRISPEEICTIKETQRDYGPHGDYTIEEMVAQTKKHLLKTVSDDHTRSLREATFDGNPIDLLWTWKGNNKKIDWLASYKTLKKTNPEAAKFIQQFMFSPEDQKAFQQMLSAKSEKVNRNAAKVKKGGRGMLAVMKGLRKAGILQTAKNKQEQTGK